MSTLSDTQNEFEHALDSFLGNVKKAEDQLLNELNNLREIRMHLGLPNPEWSIDHRDYTGRKTPEPSAAYDPEEDATDDTEKNQMAYEPIDPEPDESVDEETWDVTVAPNPEPPEPHISSDEELAHRLEALGIKPRKAG